MSHARSAHRLSEVHRTFILPPWGSIIHPKSIEMKKSRKVVNHGKKIRYKIYAVCCVQSRTIALAVTNNKIRYLSSQQSRQLRLTMLYLMDAHGDGWFIRVISESDVCSLFFTDLNLPIKKHVWYPNLISDKPFLSDTYVNPRNPRILKKPPCCFV